MPAHAASLDLQPDRSRGAAPAAPAGGGPGKQTLTEGLPAAGPAAPGATAAVTAPEAPLDPAAALALGMRGEERPLPFRAALAATAGIPLDRVRCFFGSPAQLACARMRAEAFTVGNIIVFGCDSPSQELVKHELAHVAQQGGHAAGGAIESTPTTLAMTAPGDTHEQAAEDHARGGTAAPGSVAPVLARYFATNQQEVTLYTDREGRNPAMPLALGTRVAKIHDPDDPGDGWVQVRVTHNGPIEATGYLPELQLTWHQDQASVDYQKALQLYQELAQGSFDTPGGRRLPIPFGYSAKDCQARAQAMAQLLAEKGYRSEKVFAVAERDVPPQQNKGALTSRTLLGESTRWPYHVAPVIRVTFDGREVPMVIDPALRGGRPLTIVEWMAAIDAPQYRMLDLDQVDAEIALHDENQENRNPDDKTILPTEDPPICFIAPSNVYDFVTLKPRPQHQHEQGDHRFVMEGARDLERDHGILQVKHRVIQAIQARNTQQTLHALGQLSQVERLRLLDADRFRPWLRGQFGDPDHGTVLQAFQA
jgi:hypothetical protein